MEWKEIFCYFSTVKNQNMAISDEQENNDKPQK